MRLSSTIFVLCYFFIGAACERGSGSSGPLPSQPGRTGEGLEFRRGIDTPGSAEPQIGPLAVTGFVVRTLAAGTQVGRPGETLLILKGSGLIGGDQNPVLILGADIRIDRTHLSASGRELFVIISKDQINTISKSDFNHGVVQIQLAHRDPEGGLLKFKISAEDITNNVDRPGARLILNKYFFQVEETKSGGS